MIYKDKEILQIKIEEELKNYYEEIKNTVLNLIRMNNNRYFAYVVVSGTDHCKAEGWAYEIDYKSFDDEDIATKFKQYGYTVLDRL